MNQHRINQEVARKTGETITEIARRGFSLDHWIPTEPDICPIDWDLVDQCRNSAPLSDNQHAA